MKNHLIQMEIPTTPFPPTTPIKNLTQVAQEQVVNQKIEHQPRNPIKEINIISEIYKIVFHIYYSICLACKFEVTFLLP